VAAPRASGTLTGTFERFRLWLRILSRLRGATPRMRVGLSASAFVDTCLFATARSRAIHPKSYVSGIVHAPQSLVSFRVRRGTDDIYNILPRRETDVDDYIRGHLHPGDAFVDVGANAGYYSVVAAKIVGPRGSVLAVEPVPQTFELLRENLTLNGLVNVTAVRKACWNARASLTMTLPGEYYGLASLSTPRPGARIPVETCPLDDLTADLPSIQVLKVDAERSELQVLEGAANTLARTKFVVLEATQDRARVEELLRRNAFSLETSRDYPDYLFGERR
jgi:FkbM family methyltransferase